MSWLDDTVADGHSFALCLTHDVDRPYKTYQTLHRTLVERDSSHLLDLLPDRNPYWTFEEVRSLEERLGVRSSWYFLDEQSLFGDRPPTEWLDPEAWKLYAGRYRLEDPDIVSEIEALVAGGWEVGLHGSYDSFRDRELLAREKRRLEDVLGEPVTGIRQHYLNLDRPATWERQRSVGLRYDASPGSSRTVGFTDGYEPLRPFDDDFLVFPVTVMDAALPDPETRPNEGLALCERLLAEADEHTAVMSVLWHPRMFSEDFPGYTEIYRRLIERAQELGAWIGPVGELYESLTRTGRSDRRPGDAPEDGRVGEG
jgi:peptidoglycan/xylan/chitin deacetylase (PgdA/CDA1 family)